MTADLNETGLILMAFPLHVARLYDRTIIVLLISKCVDKEVIQGIGGFFFFSFLVLLHVRTNSPSTPKLCLLVNSVLHASFVVPL
jgi:hypothetical protein